MTKEKIMQQLGLCQKARKLASGEEMVLENIKSQKAKLVFLASDAGKNTTKRITDKSSYYQIPLYKGLSSDELNQAIGKRNRKVACVIDKHFAKMFDTLQEQER